MSPKNATILPPERRRDVIRENILDMEYPEIADLCHCAERTIKRDVRQWKREGGFEEFLMDEFFRSYPNIKERFPEKAFDRLCYLLGKTITRKMDIKKEVKTEHRTDINILMERYEEIVQRAASRNMENIKQDDTEQQVHTSHANT